MSSNPANVNIGKAARHRQLLGANPPVAGLPPINAGSALSSYPTQVFGTRRIIGGAGQISIAFNPGWFWGGTSLSPVALFTINESDSGDSWSTALITPASIHQSLSMPWVGAAGSEWSGKSADCALIATTYALEPLLTNLPTTQPETQIAPLLNLKEVSRRGALLHRTKINGETYAAEGIGGSIAFATYNDRPRIGLENYSSYRALPSRATVIYPAYGRGYVGVLAPFYIDTGGYYVAMSDIAFVELEADYFSGGLITNRLQKQLFSAIVKDARNGNEFVSCGSVVVHDYVSNSDSERSLFTRARQTTSQSLSACSYLRVSLISAHMDETYASGFNSACRRIGLNPIRLSRGSSTGGNSAMPLDYEEWDFAATCKREFLAQGVPYVSGFDLGPIPQSHLTVTQSQYNRMHTPDFPGIGSPSAMLPDREALLSSASKPYYHFTGANTLADLRTADFSLVMLKSLSLIANGNEASDAASVVPVVLPADQSRFRFAGHDITGTTVRFEAESAANGVSFGRTQNPGELPVFDATPETRQTRYWATGFDGMQLNAPVQSDLSGEYWSPAQYFAVISGGGGEYDSIHNVFLRNFQDVVTPGVEVFVNAQNVGVPQNARIRFYDYTLQAPPHAEVPFRRRGMHSRGYSQSQSFVKSLPWDEEGYVAGMLAHAMVPSDPGAFTGAGAFNVMRFPVAPVYGEQAPLPLGSAASPNAPARDMWKVLPSNGVNPLPVVCGHDYHCTHQAFAGKQATAGLFSYDGEGPTRQVVVPYIGRGIKATVTHRVPFEPAGNSAKLAIADVSYEPIEVSSNLTATLDTEQVTIFVQWHASLQGLGAYVPRPSGSQEGIDIDDHRGTVSPYHYVRTSRAAELSPVLVADLWFTARGRATVTSEATFPEGLPEMQASHEGKRQNSNSSNAATALHEFDLTSQWIGSGGTASFDGNSPRPRSIHATQDITISDKMPFYAGTFVFNRDQTAALLRGESVAPTRWMEFPEGDSRGDEPQYLEWHNNSFATIKPVFRLNFASPTPSGPASP
jgi:hypothetical protein